MSIVLGSVALPVKFRVVPSSPEVGAAVIAGVGSVVVERAAEAADTGAGYQGLVEQMVAALDQLRTVLPAWLAAHVPMPHMVAYATGKAGVLQMTRSLALYCARNGYGRK